MADVQGFCFAWQGNFVLTKFFPQWRLVDPVWDGSKLHHRPRTIKPLRYKKQQLVLFALGNALMNDSWFSQTIDPSQTGSTSLIFFKWLRENKIALFRMETRRVQ